MKFPVHSISVLLLGTSGALMAVPQQASTPSSHAGHHAPIQAPDEFAKLDTDQDSFLSTAELARHPMAAHAAMVDANKDRKLDRKEFAALQQM